MYKYLCIEDFWMYRESAENGDTPAFKTGDIYLFEEEDQENPEWIVTENNHRGEVHYIDRNEIDEYFQLLETT